VQVVSNALMKNQWDWEWFMIRKKGLKHLRKVTSPPSSNSPPSCSSSTAKAGNEIEDLFNIFKESKKRKAAMESDNVKAVRKAKVLSATASTNNKFSLNYNSNPEAPLERIDKSSGLPVYKAHLLRAGDGGGTPLCPFDCNCCY
jgi:hypothetical protein